jgi:hypothetical protein
MRIRLRILLPLCHAAIDVLLLIATVYAVDAFRSTLRHPWPLWSQRYGRVDPDFLRNAWGPPMPAPLQAMNIGTLPAAIATGLIAEALFANGSLSWKVSTPFDFRLAGLHICFAAMFWYAVGCGLEHSPPRWRKLAWSYIAARSLTVPAALILGVFTWWMLCVMLFTLAWIALAVVLACKAVRHIWLRQRSATASA